MRSQKVTGVIIQKRALGEKDYSVTLLTPFYGILRGNAKGARNIKSRFTGHLDLLNVCDLEIYTSTRNNIITECSIKKNYDSFRHDLKKFFYASLISKILLKFVTENEETIEVFNLTIETLNALEDFNKEELIFEAFKIKLCNLLGFMPDSTSIKEMEIETLNENIEKIIIKMFKNPYKETSELTLNKETLEKLKSTTTYLLEHSI